jgi:hypothetical protein
VRVVPVPRVWCLEVARLTMRGLTRRRGVGGGRARAWWSAVPDQVGDGSTQQAESGGSACDGFTSCGSRYLGLRVP